MTTLETTAVVPDDRRLFLQLPQNVSPGEHRIRIEIDPLRESQDNVVTPVAWDGDVLVYAGSSGFTVDLSQFINNERDERIRKIVDGTSQ